METAIFSPTSLGLPEYQVSAPDSRVESTVPYTVLREPTREFTREELLENTTIVVLDEYSAQDESELRHEVRCAISAYYAEHAYDRKAEIPDKANFVKSKVLKAYNELGTDDYDRHHRAITIVTVTRDPDTDLEYVSGTVRLVQGKDNGLAPLDAMNLVTVEGGWPHESEGLRNDQIGELGRFVLPAWSRGVAGSELTSILYKASEYQASKRGISSIYAIMPFTVTRILNRENIAHESIDNAKFYYRDLNADELYPEAARLAKDYPGYWLKMNPRLFLFSGYMLEKYSHETSRIINSRRLE